MASSVMAEPLVSCKQKWMQGKFKVGLPSKILASANIISIDIISTAVGARLSAYNKCDAELKGDLKLFLLFPNGQSPIEVSGDLSKVVGDHCPQDSAGDGHYVEVKANEKLSAGQKGFLLIAKLSDVKDLRLTERQFEKVSESSSCTKPKYETTVYKTKDSKITYFTQTTPGCEWKYYGLFKNAKCNILGKTILDCPGGGPRAEGLHGIPESSYILTKGSLSEEYIVTDASFWEYYGNAISLIDGESALDVRNVFSDDCSSH